MSRPFRPLRAMFAFSRVAARLPAGQTVRIERVRIKQASPARRFLGIAVKTTLVCSLIQVVLGALDAEDDGGGGDGDHDEVEPVFIPFPLTTKRHDPPPYSSSDPEWREFSRMSKDAELQGKIQRAVALYVLKISAGSPAFSFRYGKPIRVTRFWLDIIVPSYPPPIYTRSGLLLTEDALAWATAPVDSSTVKRLDRTLWPRAAALSCWAFWSALVKQKTHELAKFFGLASKETSNGQTHQTAKPAAPLPASDGSGIEKTVQRSQQQAAKPSDAANDPSSVSAAAGAPPRTRSAPHDKALTVSGKPAIDQSNREARSQKVLGEEWLRAFYRSQPWPHFWNKFRREWRYARPDPPRGSIPVAGLVEVETPKAWVVWDVVAFYIPETGAFDQRSWYMIPARIREKQQRPLR